MVLDERGAGSSPPGTCTGGVGGILRAMGPGDVSDIARIVGGLGSPDRKFDADMMPVVAPWLKALYEDRTEDRWASGTYNELYRVDRAPGCKVVLRVGRDRLQTAGALRCMLLEVVLAIRTAHACFAPAVFGYGVIDGYPVTVHELFDCDLSVAFRHSLEMGSADRHRRIEQLAGGVVEALQCLVERNGMVHTDIKGENVVTRARDPRVAIIDFDPHFVVPIPREKFDRRHSYTLWMLLQIELTELAIHLSKGLQSSPYVPRLFRFDAGSFTFHVRPKGSALPGLCIDTRASQGNILLSDFWADIECIPTAMHNTLYYIAIRLPGHSKKTPNLKSQVRSLADYEEWLRWLMVRCLRYQHMAMGIAI